MKLDRVTITGADNSIPPHDLEQLSMRYPFVEWGILVSRSQEGGRRFPTSQWITILQDIVQYRTPMNLSLHVCGSWVRSLLLGRFEMPITFYRAMQRVQLNFHAQREECNPIGFGNVLMSLGADRQFIFQIDGATGNEHFDAIYSENPNCTVDAVPLFDISGGAGILPDAWPKPEWMETDSAFIYHGYAGGLGPDNLAQQIPLIAEAAGNCRIWIDMERRVRSEDDQQFDLRKVERCLQIAEPFVNGVAV